MLVDGRTIAADIYQQIKEEIKERGVAPRLAIIVCAPNFATKRYLALKEEKAAAIGVLLDTVTLSADAPTADVLDALTYAEETANGIVVQLPLPATIDLDTVVNAIPPTHDVDALNPHTIGVLSPVVAACKEIVQRHKVTLHGKRAVVIGKGRLVGAPAAQWLRQEGAEVTVISKDTAADPAVLLRADIVLTGAGDPGFLKPDMVRSGVIIFDAGTSEDGGELRGDAGPAVADKASLFTPVPGGIGPITVACLFKNLLTLSRK